MASCAFILLLATLPFLSSAAQVRYPGYKVYRITPKDAGEVQLLQQLETMGLSFWSGPNPAPRSSDVMVPPHMEDLIESLRSTGVHVTEFISDVQSLIDETSILKKMTPGAEFEFDQYHTFDDIADWLHLQGSLHPSFVNVSSIGKSFEGRDLLLMKISVPSANGNPKRAIWLDANIHAREWITSAVTLYMVNEMLNGNNPIYQKWMEQYDWYILPVHNPDGLAWSQTNNRMWRKTRSDTNSPLCKGADPNRNWDFHWMTGGSSSNPCSDTFAGHSAFSEPETYLVSQFLSTIAGSLDGFLSLHSYSQLILIPYGVDLEFPQHETYMEIGHKMAAAIADTDDGTIFTPGNIVDLLYVASGGSMDWAKGVHDIPLTYTFELRDKGRYGFVLPPAQIVPSAVELLLGMHEFVEALNQGIPSKQ